MIKPMLPRRRQGLRRVGPAWLVATLALALAACGGGARSQAVSTTLAVTQGDLVQQVSGSGLLQPARESYLNFVTNGTVAAVDVVAGQEVQTGKVLAALDTADLDQQIKQAEANLASAQAAFAALQDGPDAADLREAEAALEAARIQLDQAASGDARPSDIASAQAQVNAAEAALAALSEPAPSDLRAAEIALAEAQTSLQAARDSASAAKVQAELSLEQAATALTQSQTDYSSAYWDWKWVQERNTAPGSAGGSLSDFQRQEYYDAFAKAEATLRSAETSVDEARIALEQARQKEITDVLAAEQRVADAQRQLEALRSPSSEAVAQAEAQLAQARATLAELTGGGTAAEVALAETTVEQRAAALEGVQAPPTEAELAQAAATVAQAEAQLSEARRDRANAELVAPFDGTVAAVNITLGDSSTEGASASSSESAAIYLVDPTQFHVEVNISEVDLSRLELGQTAQVTLDALPGEVLTGTLGYIALVPTVEQNVTTYAARIDLAPSSLPLRVGMSATASIVIAEARDVTLVPNIAIQQTDEGPQVLVRRGEQDLPTPIELGLVGERETEVLGGVQPGDQVVVTAVSNTGGPGGFAIPGGGPPGGGGGRP